MFVEVEKFWAVSYREFWLPMWVFFWFCMCFQSWLRHFVNTCFCSFVHVLQLAIWFWDSSTGATIRTVESFVPITILSLRRVSERQAQKLQFLTSDQCDIIYSFVGFLGSWHQESKFVLFIRFTGLTNNETVKLGHKRGNDIFFVFTFPTYHGVKMFEAYCACWHSLSESSVIVAWIVSIPQLDHLWAWMALEALRKWMSAQ